MIGSGCFNGRGGFECRMGVSSAYSDGRLDFFEGIGL